ncbi:MAG: hypothetical protein NUV76_10670 [Candidatus Kuenenia sp.]|nr:hypothetical protein [Candidatus Kuenenia sp.]
MEKDAEHGLDMFPHWNSFLLTREAKYPFAPSGLVFFIAIQGASPPAIY